MLIYGGIICLTTALAWYYEKVELKYKESVFWIMVLLPGIMAGLRGVGTDYLLYQSRFEAIANGEYQITSFSLVYIFMKIFIAMGINYQVLIMLISILTIFLVFFAIGKYEKYISVPYAVFAYMLLFYQMSFNIFRQILAAAFLLVAFYYLIEEKHKSVYWTLFVIAVLIHSASIIFGIVYFILPIIQEKKYFKIRLLVYFVSLIVVFSLPHLSYVMQFVADKIPHYAYYLKNLQFQGIGIGVFRYILLVWVPVIYLNCNKKGFICEVPKELQYCVVMSVMGTILWMTSYTSISDMYRISYYGLLTLPVFLGFIIKNGKREKYNYILFGIITLLLIFFWWYDFIFMNSCATYPYCFWEIK